MKEQQHGSVDIVIIDAFDGDDQVPAVLLQPGTLLLLTDVCVTVYYIKYKHTHTHTHASLCTLQQSHAFLHIYTSLRTHTCTPSHIHTHHILTQMGS